MYLNTLAVSKRCYCRLTKTRSCPPPTIQMQDGLNPQTPGNRDCGLELGRGIPNNWGATDGAEGQGLNLEMEHWSATPVDPLSPEWKACSWSVFHYLPEFAQGLNPKTVELRTKREVPMTLGNGDKDSVFKKEFVGTCVSHCSWSHRKSSSTPTLPTNLLNNNNSTE